MDLAHKVVLVTGASSGIGEAVAVALGERGAHVTLAARRRERLERVAGAVRAAGGDALVAVTDVTSETSLRETFERSLEHWGRLDALINSAGIGRSASMMSGSTEDWRALLETNVLAVAVATREALRHFDPVHGGHVVNISSLSGHRVPPHGGFYPATKFAVQAMTESLRRELRAAGNSSRVCAISPGWVATEFFQGLGDHDRARLDKAMREARPLDAGDVAASVIHVLEAPPHVAIHDVLLRSNEQPS